MQHNLKDDLVKIKDKLEFIQEEFNKKAEFIDEKSKKFKDIDNKFEEVKQINDFFVRVNVGGKNFLTRFSVLTSAKDTLFFSLFSKYIEDQNFPKELFFDRSYIHFPVVLEYLKYSKLSLNNYTSLEKEEIKQELEFYGIDLYARNKREEIDIEWNMSSSKIGACSIDSEDKKVLRVHSTTCYTHFVTDKKFSDENFIIEFDSTVSQNDTYYYIGLMNENYSLTGNCGCCTPANCYYIRCDGSILINGARHNSNLAWNSQPVVIGMKVFLSEKQIYFYKDTPENEVGPFPITNGNNFTAYAGHCNSGNGNLKINACYRI
jgi:hypothetical protein